MGSGKLEEREGSLVAAKHPRSRPRKDAQFPSGAQRSAVRAQVRQGREAAPRGHSRRVDTPLTSPAAQTHPLSPLEPSHPQRVGQPAPSTPFNSSSSISQEAVSPAYRGSQGRPSLSDPRSCSLWGRGAGRYRAI